MINTMMVDTLIDDKHDAINDDVHNDGTGTILHDSVLLRYIVAPTAKLWNLVPN